MDIKKNKITPFIIGAVIIVMAVIGADIAIDNDQLRQSTAVTLESTEYDAYYQSEAEDEMSVPKSTVKTVKVVNVDKNIIPAYSGKPYIVLNNNKPFFAEDKITRVSFEEYSPLDSLGRVGVATACIGTDLMPTEERGAIGSVKPTGWHTVKYDCVNGKYLYNRCHLIGYQLSGENANEANLMTGTRQLNIDGMLPFENMVADYVKETGNHVMYRVTPVFKGDNLLADGVTIEAYSVEDEGEGIEFYVYCYNAQEGVEIDYKTGDSKLK